MTERHPLDRFASADSNAILIVGAPRSGTTWLAKILDSHPDTVYRHEPDEIVPPRGAIQRSMAGWVRQRDARTAGKRPFFAKSWQWPAARPIRAAVAYLGAARARVGLPPWPIPDLGSLARARAVVKSVRLATEAGEFARSNPSGRVLFIARHPCGQVASVMRGTRDGRFALAEAGTDMPFDEAQAIAYAARFGVDEPEFQRLPDAAKYAWSWRAFNEPAVAALAGQPNALVVVYEELCARPEQESRRILDFVGLSWHAQVETFVTRSTRFAGRAGYYAVLRDSIAAAHRWRTAMPEADQAAVLAVARASPLFSRWPEPDPTVAPERVSHTASDAR